jgi:cytochrome P450
LQSITSLIHTHFDPQTRTYDFTTLTSDPLLQSLHAETTRLYASNVAVRVVTTPSFALDEKYTIEKDTTLFIYTKYTSLFAPGWAAARPHTVTKPLDVFWPQRFLDSKGKFSEAGLSGCWTSYGGGEHKCPGRLYARNTAVVALAVLLGELECEVQGGLGGGRDVDVWRTAFGKMMPSGKIGGRVRVRREE